MDFCAKETLGKTWARDSSEQKGRAKCAGEGACACEQNVLALKCLKGRTSCPGNYDQNMKWRKKKNTCFYILSCPCQMASSFPFSSSSWLAFPGQAFDAGSEMRGVGSWKQPTALFPAALAARELGVVGREEEEAGGGEKEERRKRRIKRCERKKITTEEKEEQEEGDGGKQKK